MEGNGKIPTCWSNRKARTVIKIQKDVSVPRQPWETVVMVCSPGKEVPGPLAHLSQLLLCIQQPSHSCTQNRSGLWGHPHLDQSQVRPDPVSRKFHYEYAQKLLSASPTSTLPPTTSTQLELRTVSAFTPIEHPRMGEQNCLGR